MYEASSWSTGGGSGMKASYIVPIILGGSFFLGAGILMILLAASLPYGSYHALWTVLFNVLALMWPQLCRGCDFSQASFDNDCGGSFGDVNDVVAARTRVWVFVIVSLMMVCQGSTIWIAIANYDKAPDAWPAIALILNCFLQSISGILFFAAR